MKCAVHGSVLVVAIVMASCGLPAPPAAPTPPTALSPDPKDLAEAFDKETVMAGGFALTDRDVAMMQSLYAAGLGPGATRADLVAAGIINP